MSFVPSQWLCWSCVALKIFLFLHMRNELTGKAIIIQAAHGLSALLHQWAEALFGTQLKARAIGELSLEDLLVLLVFVALVATVHVVVAAFLRRKIRLASAHPEDRSWQRVFWNTLGKPLYLLIWIYGVYFISVPILTTSGNRQGLQPDYGIIDRAFDLGIFIVLLWAVFRFTRVLEAVLAHFAKRSASKLDDLLVPLLGRTLRIIVPILGVILGLPLIGLSPESNFIVRKFSGILIIACVAWVLFQAVALLERYLLGKYDITAADNLQARKVYTQVRVIRKSIDVLIAIFTVASMLMLFDEVRRLGTSILASAGVVGIIIGFAAQRTIANLFAGFQIAMTQPIRIDDVVIVENEWGRVEEITLTYVVIKIWDQRRLIVPLSQFIEKPFQNWTRLGSDIMGTVFLYTDYNLPLEEIRTEAKKIIEDHPKWNRKFWNLQVTDVTEKSMQLRVLVTSSDSGKNWDLRCDIREKLIAFIQTKYPQSLPKVRAELPELAKLGKAEA